MPRLQCASRSIGSRRIARSKAAIASTSEPLAINAFANSRLAFAHVGSISTFISTSISRVPTSISTPIFYRSLVELDRQARLALVYE